MSVTTELWIGFTILVAVMIWLDLFVLNKTGHEETMKESVIWSIVWIGVAFAFNGVIWAIEGSEPAITFLTAYIIERSLSVDNLFVFILIFGYFRVPAAYQHRALMLGIMGAVVLRVVLLLFGLRLMEIFEPIVYVFGAILIYSAYKMIKDKEKKIDPEDNPLIKLFRKLVPVTPTYVEDKFFVKVEIPGKGLARAATPLVVVLISIGFADIVFAVDSIPAVLAISDDSFIVITSNVLAVMGLRAMYVALAGFMGMFRFLSQGLALVLAFVGFKMIAGEAGWVHLDTHVALGVVVGVLVVAVAASRIFPAPAGAPVHDATSEPSLPASPKSKP